MAYSTSNPPALQTQAIAGRRSWVYVSTETSTDVDGAGYFTNGYALGMRAADLVFVHNTGTGAITSHSVLSASSTGGVNLSDGSTIGSTANAD